MAMDGRGAGAVHACELGSSPDLLPSSGQIGLGDSALREPAAIAAPGGVFLSPRPLDAKPREVVAGFRQPRTLVRLAGK
jgi:hypothetical protein